MICVFSGDHEKVKMLDARVTKLAGFSKAYPVCGQTYSRKVDAECLNVLASFGATAHKACISNPYCALGFGMKMHSV